MVDYRNSLSEPLPEVQKENEIFHYDHIDNGIVSYAITNDSTRPRERSSFDEVECCQKALLLRDHLRLAFAINNMTCPGK